MRRARAARAAIADDSGLCVDALGGAPGVASAHFAPLPAAAARDDREAQRRLQDAANNALLLERLPASRPARALRQHAGRAARVPTIPSRWSRSVAGTARSSTRRAAQGGFGYDPLCTSRRSAARVAELDAPTEERGTATARCAARADARADARGLAAWLRCGVGGRARAACAASSIDERLARSRAGHAALPALPPLSLYVHLPWCLKKCPYCDFNSHELRGDAAAEARYLDALVADLEASLPLVWGRRVHSVFIGGGTPSLFSPEAIDRLLADIRARLPLEPGCEITLEANPGTFERERFRGFRAAGVTRLSIGVQSFDDASCTRSAASTTRRRRAPRSTRRAPPSTPSTST